MGGIRLNHQLNRHHQLNRPVPGARGETSVTVTARCTTPPNMRSPIRKWLRAGRLAPLWRAVAYRLLAVFLILKSSIRLPDLN